jgi:transposase InsO family protein
MSSNDLPSGGEGPRHPASGRDGNASPDLPPLGETAEDRLFILDLWVKSRLKAGKFCEYVRVTPHKLGAWKRLFDQYGPAGLEPKPKGSPKGSRLPESTRTAILMMKGQHEDWGLDRIHDMLLRTEGFKASSSAIRRVLLEEGYELEYAPVARQRAEPEPREFQRARPGQLWQSDLTNFKLHRSGQNVHVVVFLDDCSRFIVGHGVTVSASGKFVQGVFLTAVSDFGPPQEVLTDRGPQYNTWRGKSGFTKLLDKLAIKHILARARHPQTVGKTERFWKTLKQEVLGGMAPRDLADARLRIGHFIDFYNFRRTHKGIEGMVPADLFFEAKPEVKATLDKRVAVNALEIAKHGVPRKAFYLTGRVGDESVSLHAQGEKVILTKEDGTREEVDLSATGRRLEPEVAAKPGMPEEPGMSELPPEKEEE